MGSSCELLSCVDAPSASLHSCKVSSRTKRGISTRGTPALATWASEKARCGAGGARTLPCERAVCRCPRCACRPATRCTASSLTRLHALHAPLCCDNVCDVRRPTYDGAGAYVTRRHTRGAYAGTRWISRQSDRAVREGKQLPSVVMVRGGGRRCTCSADTASRLSARVLKDKTVQEMGWPGRREGWCLGCGWEHGGRCIRRGDCPCENPSTASSHTPPPRLRSDVMRNEYSSGSLARSGKH